MTVDQVTPPIVEVRSVSKRFGGVAALSDVSVGITRGEVHALVGENGAGKSTLGKLIAGVHSPDSGSVLVDGRPVRFHSPRDALAVGITLIAQELALVPQRSVLDNVFLGREGGRLGFSSRRRRLERYDALAETFGLSVPPNLRVGSLRVADQQKVEILRALARDSSIIVMDEPTAALTRQEAGQLLTIIRKLQSHGTTIVYVSHFLKELLEVADTVTVLKDGRFVRSSPSATETPDTLVTSMLGRQASATYPVRERVARAAAPILSVQHLSAPSGVVDVSFDVRAGEILGVAGLVGSGRSELARSLFAADRRSAGTVDFLGRPRQWKSPAEAVRHGMGMLPESRKEQGLDIRASVSDNVLLAHRPVVSRLGFIRSREARRVTNRVLTRVGATSGRPRVAVSTLSGGNQQKVALGKWLVRPPSLLIVDEPTRGVDVGAKQAIYELLISYAADGMAILMISSEIDEILALSDRVLVMRRGRVIEDVPIEGATEESLMAAMLGSKDHDDVQ